MTKAVVSDLYGTSIAVELQAEGEDKDEAANAREWWSLGWGKSFRH